MTDVIIKEIRDLVANDRLEDALNRLQQQSAAEGDTTLTNVVVNLSGQANRIQNDNTNNLISYNDYIVARNQIRSSVLEVLDNLASGIFPKDIAVEITDTPPQRAATDMVFIILIIALFVIGIGLFVFAAVSDETLMERLFQSALALASISGSIWAYLRIKALELVGM